MARFLDSSVIVRYLTRDDEARARVARAIIERDDQELAISTLVLSETAYVLRSTYGYPRVDVIDVLMDLLQREDLDVVDASKERVLVALAKSRSRGALSFGDALILAQMQTAGLVEMYSFDTGFRDESITVLEGPKERSV